jgi:hypothetical protein
MPGRAEAPVVARRTRHHRCFGRPARELEQRIGARGGDSRHHPPPGWERGRRETLGTFGPDRGPRPRVSRDEDLQRSPVIACTPGACPSPSGSPMGRASHELARSAPTEGGRAGASDPTLPSVALTGFDHRVTLPGGDRISYVDIGPMTGRPVLYLHGTPGARLMAAGLEDAAGELGLRVLAPDRSGCGGSTFHRDQVRDYARFIARFADARGIAEFGVIGVSGGGRCAWACAPELGARVSGSRSSRARRRRSCRVCETHGADRIVSSARSPIGRRGCSELVLAGWARGVRHDPDRLWSLFNDLPAVDLVVLERPGFRAGVDAIIPRGRPAGRPRTDSRSRTQRRNSGGCPRPPMLLSCVSRQAESSYRTPPNPGQTISLR